jgi:chromosome segregation ATPase
MASRAVAISASSKASALDSTTSVASRKTTKTYKYVTDASGNTSRECHTTVDNSSDTSSLVMRKLEERIRILEEDLDSEQSLRRRVEREKHDYQAQIIALSERLTESEGGAESQLDINRKREAEMSKLRKLLEDVHTESEQNFHILRKKHQEAMMELQEQIESMSKSKEKVTKDASSMKVEISELLAQIEILSQEKITIRKVVEKLEINIMDYSSKVEQLNKTVIEVSSAKQRLVMENQDAFRKFNEMKMAVESTGLDKNKLGGQIKDLQNNCDGLTRAKNSAEQTIKNLEMTLKKVSVEFEEQRSIRIELEAGMGKAQADVNEWKKKYEAEVHAHGDNLESLKKQTTKSVLKMEDQINQLMTKLKSLDQQKVKIQQEANIVIKDFESCQIIIKELQVKIQSSDRRSEEIAIKLREMTNLYEKADKENKCRGQDIVKLANELDRAHMDGDVARKDRAKLEDELKSQKTDLEAFKKRLHEVEQENRKLAHDREELARAFKEADTGKLKAEARVQELDLELKKLCKSAEISLRSKEDEFVCIRKKMIVEIESLTIRLHETEAKLKNEVEKIKKKMAVTITELEMSLDSSNKNNVQLQNATRIQGTKIMELTTILGDFQKKMNGAAESNAAYHSRIQILETEITKVRTVLEQTVSAKKMAEAKLTELAPRLQELAGLNGNLSANNSKMEKDLGAVRLEYNDIARELKLADERANKASHDAQHFEGLLREESAKFVNADNCKKVLENEVRSLTVRMEEIETNTVATSRRTIKNMEVRIEELEVLLDREKKFHVETTTVLHKKDRSVKELLLQSEEDRKNIIILQESLDKLNEKIKMYKRQLEEQESISNSNIMRVKKFQREFEAAESRAEEAESSLNSFRSRARVFATAESRRTTDVEEVERQVVINKTTVSNQASSQNINSARIEVGGNSSSSRQEYRAGSTYQSRAGSMARSSVMRAGSVGRAGSMLRY